MGHIWAREVAVGDSGHIWPRFGPNVDQIWASWSFARLAVVISLVRTGIRCFPWPFSGHFWSISDQKWAGIGHDFAAYGLHFFTSPALCRGPCQVGWHGAKSWGGRGRVAMHWRLRPTLTGPSGNRFPRGKLVPRSEDQITIFPRDNSASEIPGQPGELRNGITIWGAKAWEASNTTAATRPR
jgi:hypothetical protein